MPYSATVAAFKTALTAVFQDNAGTSADLKATSLSNATYTFSVTGVPQTLNSGGAGLTVPQTIVSFVTTTPSALSTSGLGGLDSSTPGAGLDVGKSKLVSELKAVFKNLKNTPADAADGISKAIKSYFMTAKVETTVTGVSTNPGSAIPAPAGPVTAEPYTASGVGGVTSSTPGVTLAVSKDDLKTAIETFCAGGAYPTDYQDAAEK